MKIPEIIIKSLDEIKPYENNPRRNDDAVDKVAESIKAFGFRVPIVIDKDGVIIAGHTRYKAAIKLELGGVPCIMADDLSPKQVKAYRIADNKVADASYWDNKLLLDELDDLDDIFTGFEDGEIFNNILDETDNGVLDDNQYGVQYEVVFKSPNKEKIEKIKALWDSMEAEKNEQV